MTRPFRVYIDDFELERLEEWSRARGLTRSESVREAIRALTKADGADPLLELSGMFHGLPADGSERFDHHLLGTFVAERRARGGGRHGRGRAAAARR